MFHKYIIENENSQLCSKTNFFSNIFCKLIVVYYLKKQTPQTFIISYEKIFVSILNFRFVYYDLSENCDKISGLITFNLQVLCVVKLIVQF